MRLSDLQSKKIINITDGKSIGNIIDVYVEDNGSIESFIIETNKNFFSEKEWHLLNDSLNIYSLYFVITEEDFKN